MHIIYTHMQASHPSSIYSNKIDKRMSLFNEYKSYLTISMLSTPYQAACQIVGQYLNE